MTSPRRLHLARTLTSMASLPLAVAAPVSAQPAPSLEFVFSETVTLGETIDVGPTARGQRSIIPITGGTFEGPGIRGAIVPGAWDWQLLRADGCRELEADYFLKTDDGSTINVINKAVVCADADGGSRPVRTRAVFEPPIGKYQWLGESEFVGVLEPAPTDLGRSIKISFYRVR